jgi:hypothetical protein
MRGIRNAARLMLAFGCLMFAPVAAPAVIFEHSFATAPGARALCSICERGGNPLIGPFRVWDRFVLTVQTTIDVIASQRTMSPFAIDSSTFNYEIWNETRDVVLFSETLSSAESTIVLAFGATYNVTSDISNILLPTGAYYLSIVGRNEVDDDAGWGLSPVTVNGFGYQTQDLNPFGAITTANFDAAFRLIGTPANTVSEPSVAGLLVLATVVLVRLRHRNSSRR